MFKWLFFILIVSCQPLVEKMKSTFGSQPQKENVKDLNAEYIPPPSPTMEQDAVMKVDSRKKFFSLLDGFIREPDQGLKELILEEFKKFSLTLNLELDSELASALQKLRLEFSANNPLHVLLMYQMSKELKGANQKLCLSLLAKGFESSALNLLDVMAKKSEDVNCDLSILTPEELSIDEKKMILASRYSNLQGIKNVVQSDVKLALYLEMCSNRLKVEYQIISGQTPVETAPTENEELEKAQP